MTKGDDMAKKDGFRPRFYRAAIVAILLLVCGVPVSTVAGKVYRWTDENGVVHFSDKLPPESSKREHKVLDQQGQTVDEIQRAKTREELLQEEARTEAELAEQRRLAEIKARERRRDQILLQTFTTERDLLLTRDDRLAAIDSIINLTVSNNERIDAQLEQTRKKIETFKNSGRDVPDNLSEKLETLQEQRRKNEEFIERKRGERREEEERFASDLERFRELKNINPSGGEAGSRQAESGTPPESPTGEQKTAGNTPASNNAE